MHSRRRMHAHIRMNWCARVALIRMRTRSERAMHALRHALGMTMHALDTCQLWTSFAIGTRQLENKRESLFERDLNPSSVSLSFFPLTLNFGLWRPRKFGHFQKEFDALKKTCKDKFPFLTFIQRSDLYSVLRSFKRESLRFCGESGN